MWLTCPSGPTPRQRQTTVIISLIVLALLTAFAVTQAVQPILEEDHSNLVAKSNPDLERRQFFGIDSLPGSIFRPPAPVPNQDQPAITTPLPAAGNNQPQGPFGALGGVVDGALSHITSHAGGIIATLTARHAGGGAAAAASTVNIGDVVGTFIDGTPVQSLVNAAASVGGSVAPAVPSILSGITGAPNSASSSAGGQMPVSIPGMTETPVGGNLLIITDTLAQPVGAATSLLNNPPTSLPSAVAAVTDSGIIMTSMVPIGSSDPLTNPVIPDFSSNLGAATVILPESSTLPTNLGGLNAPQLPDDSTALSSVLASVSEANTDRGGQPPAPSGSPATPPAPANFASANPDQSDGTAPAPVTSSPSAPAASPSITVTAETSPAASQAPSQAPAATPGGGNDSGASPTGVGSGGANVPANVVITTVTAFVLPGPTAAPGDGGNGSGSGSNNGNGNGNGSGNGAGDSSNGDGASSTPCSTAKDSQPTNASGHGDGNSSPASNPNDGSANSNGSPNNGDSGNGKPTGDGSGNGNGAASTPGSTANGGQPTGNGSVNGAGPGNPPASNPNNGSGNGSGSNNGGSGNGDPAVTPANAGPANAATTPCITSNGGQPTIGAGAGAAPSSASPTDPNNGSGAGNGSGNGSGNGPPDTSGTATPANSPDENGASPAQSPPNPNASSGGNTGNGNPNNGAGAGAASGAPSGNGGAGAGAGDPNAGSGNAAPNNAAPKAASDCSGWKLLGCFKDSNIRTLDGDPSDYFAGSMSNEKCIAHCASMGFKLAGTEYGTECWCGNMFQIAERLPRDQCNKPCDGLSTDICGGDWAATVYSADGQALSMPSDDDAGNGSGGNGSEGDGGAGDLNAGNPSSPPQGNPPAGTPANTPAPVSTSAPANNPAPAAPTTPQSQPAPAPAGNPPAAVTPPPTPTPPGLSQAELEALLQSIINSLPKGSPDGGYSSGLGARDSGAGGNNAPAGTDNGYGDGGLPDLGPLMGPGPVVPPEGLTGYGSAKKSAANRYMKRSRIIGRRAVADHDADCNDEVDGHNGGCAGAKA
ncbi:Xylosyltransferase oxt [Colletotrichum sp. SAR11_239]|nr:Xylosyltransferase oxt [Colletotrichum sp. SAR11_239]